MDKVTVTAVFDFLGGEFVDYPKDYALLAEVDGPNTSSVEEEFSILFDIIVKQQPIFFKIVTPDPGRVRASAFTHQTCGGARSRRRLDRVSGGRRRQVSRFRRSPTTSRSRQDREHHQTFNHQAAFPCHALRSFRWLDRAEVIAAPYGTRRQNAHERGLTF